MGSAVLDIGGNTGALVVVTGPEWSGREIEISTKDQDPLARTRAAVRARHTGAGTRYTAVFPTLPAGPYVIWRTATEPAGTVVVAGASVTEIEWWQLP
ncbi:phospholipase [Phytohabitans kaempferiae]|uniref:Phospholipase n=1 Tax=Phytohabitans kaempferiae TaxID=1620943 RepID=A0ABV6M4T9_9ACTN